MGCSKGDNMVSPLLNTLSPKHVSCIEFKTQERVLDSIKEMSVKSSLSVPGYCKNMAVQHGGPCGEGPAPYLDLNIANRSENTTIPFFIGLYSN